MTGVNRGGNHQNLEKKHPPSDLYPASAKISGEKRNIIKGKPEFNFEIIYHTYDIIGVQ